MGCEKLDCFECDPCTTAQTFSEELTVLNTAGMIAVCRKLDSEEGCNAYGDDEVPASHCFPCEEVREVFALLVSEAKC